MKNKFIAVILLLLSLNGYAQWQALTTPTSNFLRTVHFVNENTGWAAGFQSTIIKTTNGGQNWSLQVSAVTMNINDLHFINASTGWSVGGGEFIQKTTNGGQNWISAFNLGNLSKTSVHFLNENIGFVTTGISVYRTTDGGASWGVQGLSATGSALKVHVFNPTTAVILGTFGKFFKTTNGGISWLWEGRTFPDVPVMYAMDVTSENNVMLAGASGSVLITSNGGTNWNSYNTGNNVTFNSIDFTSNTTGWVCGDKYIMKSTDGGVNWGNQLELTGESVAGLFMVNSGTGYASGTSGKVYKTTNGGGAITSLHQVTSSIPSAYELKQNYPNPFNPSTKIEFALPKSAKVTLKIYDAAGKQAATLVNSVLNAGSYGFVWNSSLYSSGVYYYELIAGDFKEVKKMILIK